YIFFPVVNQGMGRYFIKQLLRLLQCQQPVLRVPYPTDLLIISAEDMLKDIVRILSRHQTLVVQHQTKTAAIDEILILLVIEFKILRQLILACTHINATPAQPYSLLRKCLSQHFTISLSLYGIDIDLTSNINGGFLDCRRKKYIFLSALHFHRQPF